MTNTHTSLYCAQMYTRLLLTASVLVNATIGSLCMMPMAMAADMPMQHDEAMEMVMTPMEPMTPAHCEHCAHLEKQQPPLSEGCAGHCLSHTTNTNPTNVVTIASQLAVALPTAVPIVLNSEEQVLTAPEITPSPPPIATDTVVLTL